MLRVEGISVSYGPVRAVDNVSIEVNEGEIVVLIGANGAGKTTLLRAILGVDKAQSGKVLFLGNDITGKSTDRVAKSGLGLIPEGHLVFSTMTVLENLQLGGYHNPREIDSNLESVFESFPVLRNRLDQTAGTLSGGEQQMLSIARALMSRPKLIMADEPSLGLAPKVVSEIFDILRDLNKKGYTILLAEQNAKKALEFGNRGYVMETGRVVLEGPTQELMSNPEVRHAYLGSNV
ncbi:MAG TPA: ABC transporter ATP-binding protein [Firmicutes bacterium]|jgi:branched-chain amino acid transport system ATP-binding protein|nr:ABC transporter ATP-binding protein [Bacillota bacterium]